MNALRPPAWVRPLEAAAAASAYRDLGRGMAKSREDCASGQKLIGGGYGEEVALAAKQNVSNKVRVGKSFRSA